MSNKMTAVEIFAEYAKRGMPISMSEQVELQDDSVWVDDCCKCLVCEDVLLHDDDIYGGGYCSGHSILNEDTGECEVYNPLPTVFWANGYYKPGADKHDKFKGYLFYEADELAEFDDLSDDDLFFFGENMSDMQKRVLLGESAGDDFVITSFGIHRENPDWWDDV